MVRYLEQLPKGAVVFIDTNIFHLYLRGPRPIRDSCTAFLERVEEEKIMGYTSTLVLDELAYKLLLRRVEELYKRNPLEVIREKREVVAEVAPYVENGLNIVLGIEGLQVLSVESFHLSDFMEYVRKYSLLPRDALHVTIMVAINCKNIASADEDFDLVPFIVRWSPV